MKKAPPTICRQGDPEGSRLKSTLPIVRIELVLVPGCSVSRVTEIVWPSYLSEAQSASCVATSKNAASSTDG